MKRHDIFCMCKPCMKPHKPKRKKHKRNANATKPCRHVEFTRFTVVVKLSPTMKRKCNTETRLYVRCNKCGSRRRVV